jgi:hypothetical protein
MNPAKAKVRDILYAAMAEPIGLLVMTNEPTRLKALFYSVRRECQDQELDILQLRTSPFPEGQFVICKGKSASRLLDEAS